MGDDVGDGAHKLKVYGPPSAGFKPEFLVQPSSGVVLETVINYFLDGRQIRNENEIGPDGRVVGGGVTFGTPGAYVAVVTRTGITNVGITVLKKKELDFRVTSPRPSAHRIDPRSGESPGTRGPQHRPRHRGSNQNRQ